MKIEHNTKWRMILSYLADGNSLNRFQAEPLGCHCLHTTVASLQARGITIARESITLEGRFGEIHCKRYWIEPDERERARKLLGLR